MRTVKEVIASKVEKVIHRFKEITLGDVGVVGIGITSLILIPGAIGGCELGDNSILFTLILLAIYAGVDFGFYLLAKRYFVADLPEYLYKDEL